MPETAQKAGNAEGLTGRIAEYQELLDVLDQRPGLTVISGDPWSGTSALLATVIDELHGTRVLVDARSCADSRDLAMATSRHGHRPARPRRGRMVGADSATHERRRPATRTHPASARHRSRGSSLRSQHGDRRAPSF
jgi:hypothetical protein